MIIHYSADMLKDTFLFTNKMGYHRSSEDYLLPYTALAYAQELKRRGYEVLLIVDEIQEHLLKEILIFNTAKVPVVRISPSNHIITLL